MISRDLLPDGCIDFRPVPKPAAKPQDQPDARTLAIHRAMRQSEKAPTRGGAGA